MSFSPNDIAYFLEAVRQQHFGRAALAVGVTQPAITKAIRRLEDASGVALFERGGGGVRLTAEGQLFLDAARRFEVQHAELQNVADELRAQRAGLLRLGITNPDVASPVVAVLAMMLRQRLGLRVTLIHATSDLLNDAVERGDLDAAVAPAYPGIRFSCAQVALSASRLARAIRCSRKQRSSSQTWRLTPG
jgi:DNA-binding transcriptional LysR family regulator